MVEKVLEYLASFVRAGLLEIKNDAVIYNQDTFIIKLTEEGMILYDMDRANYINKGELSINIEKDSKVYTIAYLCNGVLKLLDKKLIIINNNSFLLTDVSKDYLRFMGSVDVESADEGRGKMRIIRKIRFS